MMTVTWTYSNGETATCKVPKIWTVAQIVDYGIDTCGPHRIYVTRVTTARGKVLFEHAA